MFEIMRFVVIVATLYSVGSTGFSAHSEEVEDNTENSTKSSYEQVFSNLALHCIHQEYPNVVKHTMNNVDDVNAPHILYPAFYGCLDWHSSVHGHWLLVRLLNKTDGGINKNLIIDKLNQSFTPNNIKGELSSLVRPNNVAFERPYGLAWFLQLTSEIRQSNLPEAKQWQTTLAPLEAEIVDRISNWLPKLAYPIRTGEHSQTAFAFGLMLDWSRVAKNTAFEELLTNRVKHYYLNDQHCPLSYEPSGQDFLSPCLAEADLMRRVLPKDQYSDWLTDFFPNLNEATQLWLSPATVTDKSDGKLAHLDGLNLSRSWMMEGIINALDSNDKRLVPLQRSLAAHRKAGLDSVFGEMHYMGSHWLGSFATYLETERGTH